MIAMTAYRPRAIMHNGSSDQTRPVWTVYGKEQKATHLRD